MVRDRRSGTTEDRGTDWGRCHGWKFRPLVFEETVFGRAAGSVSSPTDHTLLSDATLLSVQR